MRLRTLVIFASVTATALAPNVMAEAPATALKKCASITEDAKRLKCYDDIANAPTRGEGESKEDEPAPPGRWQIKRLTSKLDDSSNAYSVLESNEPVQARANFNQQHASLVINCREKETSLYIIFGVFLGSDSISLTYRIDKQPLVIESWSISTDHTAAGLWQRNQSIPFIRKLAGAKELVVRVTPYSESPVILTFDLTGIEAASKAVEEACKWQSDKPKAGPKR